MSLIVRPFLPTDAESVRNICMQTSPRRIRTETKRFFLYRTACDYYLECEPENCVVAVETDEQGNEKVVGYVLCAMDCEKFAKRYMDRFMPKLKEYGKMNAHFAKMDVMIYAQFANFFPSHLRLCVLKSYQTPEVISELWQNIKILLENNSSKGVCLIVPKNEVQIGEFLLKNGFALLQKVGGDSAFGYDF